MGDEIEGESFLPASQLSAPMAEGVGSEQKVESLGEGVGEGVEESEGKGEATFEGVLADKLKKYERFPELEKLDEEEVPYVVFDPEVSKSNFGSRRVSGAEWVGNVLGLSTEEREDWVDPPTDATRGEG